MCVFAGGQLVFSQVITGGSVWKQGVLQAVDEIKQLDDVVIESMELPEITRIILGQVRICLSARMSAVVDCHNNRNSMTVTSLSKSLIPKSCENDRCPKVAILSFPKSYMKL